MPTVEHMNDLQVIESVLHETLCLYPPIPVFARQCIKEHTISNSDGQVQIRISVDAMIAIPVYILHRREEYWSCPLDFDYHRWIRDPITGQKSKLSHAFAYLPFAAGSQNFALLEAKITLTMFVQQCTFELAAGQRVVADIKGATMPPVYGMFARLTRRNIC